MLVYELETDGALIHWSSARSKNQSLMLTTSTPRNLMKPEMTVPPGNLMLTTPSPGILMLMTFTLGNLMLMTQTQGISFWPNPLWGICCLQHWCWWHPPSLMKETDIDETYSREYDVNNTHPYERVWCWWHPPQGICFSWHQPWESDVDDTHTGESDVENNALPPPRESDVDDASHHKIRHWKNFLMDGVRSRLSWIKSMTFFSHSSLQRTFDISAKSSRSNQRENMTGGKGFPVHILLRKYARWTQLHGVQRTLFTGH